MSTDNSSQTPARTRKRRDFRPAWRGPAPPTTAKKDFSAVCSECDFAPCLGWEADPARLAGAVISILASGGRERHWAAGQQGIPGLPLRTVAGAELIAAGLDVDLDVYPDLQDFRVVAELVVTNPDHPERGEVSITDDGSVIMECNCREGIGTAGTEEIAESIAGHVSDAITKFSAAVRLPPMGT